VGEGEMPSPPYSYIEDTDLDSQFLIPSTEEPRVFQGTDSVTDEEVLSNRSQLILEVMKLMKNEDGLRKIKPLLPLRKGHLVTLLTAGFLDGRVETSEEPIWIKGFSDRTSCVRTEDDKEITCNTYSIGIRVLEKGGKWYDIQ
jgi:hypothetical protein